VIARETDGVVVFGCGKPTSLDRMRRMIEIARQIIAQQQGPFAPEAFRDRYEEAVRALIERKAKGSSPVHRPAPEPGESNVIDLMEALRRSLKGGDRPAARPQPEPPAERRTTGTKAAGPRRKPGAASRRRASG